MIGYRKGRVKKRPFSIKHSTKAGAVASCFARVSSTESAGENLILDLVYLYA